MASSTTRAANRRSPNLVHKKTSSEPVKLLSGGNPQIAKGNGDVPVQAYIAAMPGWKSSVGRRLDALLTRHLPNVQKAVRWNSPFYGMEGNGWLISLHVLSRHVQVNFFCGSELEPVPPGKGKDPRARWLNIAEGDKLDEEQLVAWLKQAANLKGWASFSA